MLYHIEYTFPTKNGFTLFISQDNRTTRGKKAGCLQQGRSVFPNFVSLRDSMVILGSEKNNKAMSLRDSMVIKCSFIY